MSEHLFAYGTLNEADVQHYVFGRSLGGQADSLPGYVISERKMYGRYLVLEQDPSKGTEIRGMCYTLSMDDLLKADIYEGPEYKRIQLPLKSGCIAWVYVAKEETL